MDLLRSFISSLVPLDRVHNISFFGGILFVYALAYITHHYYYSSSSSPSLTKTYQHFPIIARRIVNQGERPVIFLTVRVSTASLPTGAHVKVRVAANVIGGGGNEAVVRSYTPTRFNRGECELMFRVYEGGPMTTYLSKLKVGDKIDMLGPTGLERYASHGPGTFSRGDKVWEGITHVALVSGGTGITPMLQIANHVLQDVNDKTKLSLISFTTSTADIMLENELRTLASSSNSRLRLTFVVSKLSTSELRDGISSDIRHASMRELNKDTLEALLSVPNGPNTMICLCGPDGFVSRAKELLLPNFKNLLVW